jgi:hypothetical protein
MRTLVILLSAAALGLLPLTVMATVRGVTDRYVLVAPAPTVCPPTTGGRSDSATCHPFNQRRTHD